MDYFKLSTLIGILFSIVLGLANLWITYHERKKGIREHLFKEQIEFFKKLSAQFVVVAYLFDDVEFEEELTEARESALEKEINKLDRLLDEGVFILPTEEMFAVISNAISQADELLLILMKKQGKGLEKDYDLFFDAYYEAIEDVRDYYNVEELSEETLSLSRQNSKRKLKRR